MPTKKKEPDYYGPALHIIEKVAADRKGDIKPGKPHKLGFIRVTFDLPEDCLVVRELGNSGPDFPGYNDDTPAAPHPPSLTVNDFLLWIERAFAGNAMLGASGKELAANAIKDSRRGLTAAPPGVLMEALMEYLASLPAPPPEKADPLDGKTKTPANRIGAKGVTVSMKRMPKPKNVKKQP